MASPPEKAANPAKPARTLSRLRTYRVPWADLLEKVFAIDVLACPECGGRLRLVAFIPESEAAKRILDHLGLDATGPPAAPPRSVPEHFEPAPGYDLADPVYEG